MEEQTIKFLNKTFTLAAVLVLGILAFFVAQMVYQSRSLDQQNANQITVSGEGKIYAKPDVAIVSLGVTTQATTVADVTTSNTTKMNAVIQAIKDLKIDEKDIQTTNYSLTPIYGNSVVPVDTPTNLPMIPSVSGGSGSGSGSVIIKYNVLKGYTLEQDVQVKIRDFTKIGDVLSQATAKGANLVGDLQFTIDNPEQFKDQARAQAIAQAKINAQNLAKESGVHLGELINVYEGYTPSPLVYNAASAMGGGVESSAPVPTVQPGQQEIDVTINLTYKVN